jgi:hypothetical protein
MNFKDNLWDQLDLIAIKSQERRKIFDEFTSLTLERSSVEEQYAKNLERLSK